MRVLFVLCALLAIAVTSLARPKDNVNEKTTTAVPMVITKKNDSLNTTPPSVEKSTDKLTGTTAYTPLSVTTTDNQKNHTTPDVTPIKKLEVTTSEVTTLNSKNIPTTAITPFEKIVTPIKPTTTIGDINSSTIETTSNEVTTAIPATSVCPPPAERHFDGLSFLGGIILAICLIGIGVFLCKYCQNIHKDKYRTL